MRRAVSFAFALAVAVPALALAQEEPLPADPPGLEEPPPSPPPGVAPPPATPAPPPPGSPPPAPAPLAARPSIQLPPSLALMQAESGRLDSHVDLQFLWSHISYSMSFMGTSVSIDADGIMLGLEGQYAIADRFEVGLTIPFLLKSWGSVVGGTSSGSGSSDSQFGNLMVDLKLKLAGSSHGAYAVSLFANWILPTMSGDIERDYAALHGGVAASGAIGLLTLGGALGTFWAINGDGKDLAFLLFDLHTGARFHRVIGAYLMLQLGVPVYPDMNDRTPAVAIVPGVQLFPLPPPIDGLHLDLGVRIATNDQAKALYSALSRAQLHFAMGYAF
jgi:hypothetical protein